MAKSSGANDNSGPTREIRLTENPDGQWTARDLDAEVSAQGRTASAALEALDAVLEALEGTGGHEPTAAELEALGVDPETAEAMADDLPDVLQ